MADEKPRTEQSGIERAQRLRRVIENLKTGNADEQESFSEGKSLKEQIDERAARIATQRPGTPDSE